MAGPEQWTTEFMDDMRRTMDKAGDKFVRKAYEKRGGLAALNALLTLLIDEPILQGSRLAMKGEHAEAMAADLDAFIAKQRKVVADFDQAYIEQAEEIFSSHGVLAIVVLIFKSLPETYLDQEGTTVLEWTGELENHIYRRIWETSRMIASALMPGGLREDGDGTTHAIRVRLMHASVRFLVLHYDPQQATGEPIPMIRALVDARSRYVENPERVGPPINQEDMAYALMSFSFVLAEGLSQLGIDLNVQQRRAWVYTWNRVGLLLGMDERLFPDTYDDAARLFAIVKGRRAGPSSGGKALTAALIQFFEKILFLPPFRSLPRKVIYMFNGAEDSAMLGLRLGPIEALEARLMGRVLHAVGRIEEELERNFPILHYLREAFYIVAIHVIWLLPPRLGARPWTAPEALLKAWKLNPEWAFYAKRSATRG